MVKRVVHISKPTIRTHPKSTSKRVSKEVLIGVSQVPRVLSLQVMEVGWVP